MHITVYNLRANKANDRSKHCRTYVAGDISQRATYVGARGLRVHISRATPNGDFAGTIEIRKADLRMIGPFVEDLEVDLGNGTDW